MQLKKQRKLPYGDDTIPVATLATLLCKTVKMREVGAILVLAHVLSKSRDEILPVECINRKGSWDQVGTNSYRTWANHLGIDKTAVYNGVRKLIENGFIRRTSKGSDEFDHLIQGKTGSKGSIMEQVYELTSDCFRTSVFAREAFRESGGWGRWAELHEIGLAIEALDEAMMESVGKGEFSEMLQ